MPHATLPHATLRTIPWFRTASDGILDEVDKHAKFAPFDDGEHLWNAGDTASHFAFVVRGLVKLTKVNGRGDENMIGVFGPGDGIGIVATMGRRPFPATAIAATSGVVARIEAACMFACLERHPELHAKVNATMLVAAQSLAEKIDVLCAGPVPARLACLFLHLAERFGTAHGDGASVAIALSRGSLAKLVSAREETIIRVLSGWRQQGLLLTSDDGFEIPKLGVLEALLASDREEPN